jgi:TolB protein
LLPPHNFEIFLLNLQTLEETRITYNDAFDGFPTFSPDGNTVAFSSSRDAAPGDRSLSLYLLDISNLHLGKQQ